MSEWLIYIASGIGLIITMIICIKTGKFIKYFLISAVSGVALLFILNFLGPLLGAYLPINSANIVLSAAGGIPGTLFALALTKIL